MITFEFIQKIHKLIAKFPERRGEYEILYPEAFKKVDITDDVEFKLSGAPFQTFRLYDGEYYFAEMKPFIQTLQVVEQRACAPKEKMIRSLAFPGEAGYEIEVKAGGCYGFRIWRYGEKEKIIKLSSKTMEIIELELDSAAEKNRIKEKS